MTQLNEGLEYKCMVGIVNPTVYIDEFVSKVGSDDEIAVISFYVNSSQVADDMVNWFEKGYDFVIDADRSPGEIKPNRFLVYVEIKRRTRLIDQLEELLDDLSTLTEYEVKDWIITHDNKETPFNKEALTDMLDLSPHVYRQNHEEEMNELNEMRTAANLPVKPIHKKPSKDLDHIRSIAGLL